MSENNPHINRRRGFTIVELLVIAPIVILTITAFISVIVNMTGDVLASRSSNVVAYDIQDALARIEEDVKLSSTFLAENTITTAPPGDPILLPSPQGYADDTAPFRNVDSTKGDILILNTFATSGNPITLGSSLIYLTDQPNACNSTQINQNTPMSLNVVYFVKNTSLWRRTVAPTGYDTAGCSTPWQQPSCAVGQTASFCKTEDIKLLDNITVNDFNVEYFTSADSSTANADASNVAKTVPERNTALQSSTTVGVSLNVTKTVAGREVSQSGSIRSTRLDINASSIAPVIVPTTPSAPAVTASYAAPNIVTFTWPSVPGAVSYTFQYQLNGTGGAWTTAFTGQNTTSFSVSSANHGDVVYGRASATNAASPMPQTSAYSSNATATIPKWITPLLQNSWTNFGSTYQSAAYTKTSDGLVVLKGMIKKVTGTPAGEVIATLPVGYRPSDNLMFGTSTNSNVSGRIDVRSNGDVIAVSASASWLSLESIRFMPAGTPHTRVTPALVNGWTNYAGFAPASYTYDNNGRVVVQGVVAPGTITNGTRIFDLPANRLPYLYQHIATRSTAHSHVGVDNRAGGTGVLAKGVGSTYLSLSILFLGSSSGASWTNLSLVNGWVWYSDSGGIFSTPQYTKTTDGLVVLKGLIRSGSTTYDSVIATLPAGYRPSERILTTTANSANYSRIDILANGEIHFMGADNGWYSLDSVNFIAD